MNNKMNLLTSKFYIILSLVSAAGGIHKIIERNNLDAFNSIGLGTTFGMIFGLVQVIGAILIFWSKTKKMAAILLSIMLIFTVMVLTV